MNKYVGVEIGNSAYTEFKMQSGEFETTDDGIFLGSVLADNESQAIDLLKSLPENKLKEFEHIIIFEVLM